MNNMHSHKTAQKEKRFIDNTIATTNYGMLKTQVGR